MRVEKNIADMKMAEVGGIPKIPLPHSTGSSPKILDKCAWLQDSRQPTHPMCIH